MLVQSVVFPKDKFTQGEALRWLIDHGYKHEKIDITPNTYRFRQHNPIRDSYYAKTLPNGVILIIHS